MNSPLIAKQGISQMTSPLRGSAMATTPRRKVDTIVVYSGEKLQKDSAKIAKIHENSDVNDTT